MTFLVVLMFAALARAQTFTDLYNFTGTDGAEPFAGVIQDKAGNLYGAAGAGGDMNCDAGFGCGVVFELNTAGTETVLHSFSGSPDGEYLYTPVTRDKAGNIYGTTYQGGTSSNCGYGCGTVFKIDTAGNETVLYSFTGTSDGAVPNQGLVMDKAGNLYGTTYSGGKYQFGTIFKIDRAGKFTILHTFVGAPIDGASPVFGRLAMDKAGNLHGVTTSGGAYNYGALYKLSERRTLTLPHSFKGGTTDGCEPYGSVVQDEAGNFYGTTYECGSNSDGTIWKVSRKGKEAILHNFAGGKSDGCYPLAGVTMDSHGNLYGVAACGAHAVYGALYELSPSGTLTLLHSFDYSDGFNPVGEVLRTAKGTLFGTTAAGGTSGSGCGGSGCGTVWSYVP